MSWRDIDDDFKRSGVVCSGRSESKGINQRLQQTKQNSMMLRCFLFSVLCCLQCFVLGQSQEGQPFYASFYSSRDLNDAVDVYMAEYRENATEISFELQSILSTYGPMEEWKVGRIPDFSNLFNVKRKPLAASFRADLSRWDVSNADSMIDMFLESPMNFDVSLWNVSKVVRFNGMWDGATAFTGQGLSEWQPYSGKYFQNMFRGCNNLTVSTDDLSKWNVRNALNMNGMFANSNFGLDENDAAALCAWPYRTLYPGVTTQDMFSGSTCANTTSPDLNQRADHPIAFCHNDCTAYYNQYYANRNKSPNILFLMTDQQRYDAIGYVQNRLARYDIHLKIRTPNLDALLQSGAYFENAYTQCAVCAPARTTIRTGCTIERTGIQHNDLVTEYQNGKWFQDRVESLVSLDHVLVETRGYLSEYYGKWHIPDKLMYSKANGQNIIQYNDYDFAQEEPYFLDDSDGRKNMRFLEHFQRQGMISKDLQDGQQYDTYTGFPYTPIQLDSRARHGSPTGTPLTTNHGFEIYEITQPNVVGEFALSDDYTPSHFTAHVANEALLRLKQQSDPWFLTVSFHNPHPPMIPASKHLEYYWSNRESLFVSPNMIDDLSNSAYGNIVDKIPDYQDEEKVKEWTALYYALVEEIDEEVGTLLSTLGDDAVNTLVIFTSDHGEMLGAHGKREKNNFHEESSRVPLFISWPGKILANTKVEEKVSHLDLFSTILDYTESGEYDNSDGKSLRRFIEQHETNVDFDEDAVFAEWDFRKPPVGWGNRKMLELEDAELDREIDDRPGFLVRKGDKKLMMQKLAASEKLDMMFDLDADPFEMENLLGTNGMSASNSTIIQAEHMRCLLLGWMGRLDGSVGYFSDPAANYGQGSGDIVEIRDRQSWRAIGFWTSVSDTGILEMGNVAWSDSAFVRHDWLYMGTRVNGQKIRVSSLSITGADAGLFTVDENVPIEFVAKACVAIRISFSSPTTLATTPIDAFIAIEWSEIDDTGSATSPLMATIQLTMKNYNFDSQRLGYPPPPTLAPTLSPAPITLPIVRPTTAPVPPTDSSTAPPDPANAAPSPLVPTVTPPNADNPTASTTDAPSIASSGAAGESTSEPLIECGPDCEMPSPAGAAAASFVVPMLAACVACTMQLLS